MLVHENLPQEASGANQPAGIDERDRRALTEYLTVLGNIGRAKDAPGLYLVVSHSGREYLVDMESRACECADSMYRHPRGGCKHVRRVAFEIGERPVPPEFAGHVPSDFSRFVDAEPKIATTDGGAITSEQRGRALPPTDEREVVDTGSGYLVYDTEEECGRRLIGFADVSDWEAFAEAVRARGHTAGDILHLPEFSTR